MARLAMGVVFGVIVSMTSGAAHAQTEDPEIGTGVQCARDVNGCTEHPELLDDVRSAAADADVDVTDLLGAVNTTGMEPRTYLCLADHLLCPPAPPVISACGWPICGALGQRLNCIEFYESHHNGAAVNRSSGAAGWLQWLPGTARTWRVQVGNRWSEWQGASRIAALGERFFTSQWVALQRGLC